MTHTENYSLPQWDAADLLKRADFNGAFAAIDAALASAGGTCVATGTYTGDGTTSHTIELPFTPSVLVIYGHWGESRHVTVVTADFAFYVGHGGSVADVQPQITLLENGFRLGNAYFHNTSGQTECYIALR